MTIPNVNKQNILDALKKIDQEGVPPKNQSTKYDLVTEDGKKYPAKYVVAIASNMDNFNSLEAKSCLEHLGFVVETNNIKYELTITADSVVSTDEMFSMEDLGRRGDMCKPLKAYFQSADGTITYRKYIKNERTNTNQTMPRIACQLFEKQISEMSIESRESFPVCQYGSSSKLIKGIYSDVEEYKKNCGNSLEFCVYHCEDGRYFVFYCWNIFSTIIFVQECIKRFGKPGDKMVLIYEDKKDHVSDISNISNYWWLNAKPKEWSFSDIEAGTSQSYSFYNEKGNKRRIFQNYQDAKVGDLVIGYETAPVLKVVALAKVSAKTEKSISFEIVEHLENPIDYKVLKKAPELSGMEFFVNPNGSLFKLSKDEYDYITNVIWEERPPVKEQTAIVSYTKEDFLRDVYISGNQYEKLRSVLKYKKNIILQGPPGVGKTWMAKRLAWSCMGKMQNDHIKMIQFHQNYSYEDFVCGYKPDDEGFTLKTGVFYDFCERAKRNKREDFFFIIDEINRGNMSKIFGELLMLIENEYRNEAIQLQYSDLPPFEVPDNVYIIGMMNTADRSLAMIDYALRRRFSFFDIEPCFTEHKDNTEKDAPAKRFEKYIQGLKNDTLRQLIEIIKKLNTDITDNLGKGFCIGHSYFCNLDNLKAGITIEERLKEIVEYEIIPMLREYWFDNSDKVGDWEINLNEVIKKNEG